MRKYTFKINICVENCLTLFFTNDNKTTFRVSHQTTLVTTAAIWMLKEKEKKGKMGIALKSV